MATPSPWPPQCSHGQGVLWDRAAPHPCPASQGQGQDLAVCGLRSEVPPSQWEECACRTGTRVHILLVLKAHRAYTLVVGNVWGSVVGQLLPQELGTSSPCLSTGVAGVLGKEPPTFTGDSLGAGWWGSLEADVPWTVARQAQGYGGNT